MFTGKIWSLRRKTPKISFTKLIAISPREVIFTFASTDKEFESLVDYRAFRHWELILRKPQVGGHCPRAQQMPYNVVLSRRDGSPPNTSRSRTQL